MQKILFLLLALVAPASAQQANFNYLSQSTSQTVTPANVFANVVTQQSGRQSCWIQYHPVNGVPQNVATTLGFVFFGPTAPAGNATTSAFVLNSFGIITCEAAAEVEGNGIWVTSNQTSDTFTIKVK